MAEIFIIDIKFRFLFRPVHPSIDMIRRGICRDDLHVLFAGINEIMLRSWCYDNNVSTGEYMFFIVQADGTYAGNDVERLLDMVVSFFANFSADRNGHDDKLGLIAGKDHFPEVFILLHQVFDVSYERHKSVNNYVACP